MQITDLVYIDETGYNFSDYTEFLNWLQDQYRTIYGADVYLESDSLDGQFLAILAKAFYDTASLGASIYNSFSPATAQGVGLSRNVKINGLKRQVASKSTVDLTIVGSSGTVISNGIATDSLSQKWLLPETVTIPSEGSIIVTATAENEGDVSADTGTVNQIFTPTLGWQTVTNVSAATPGAPIETDAELRVRQIASTANPSLTVLEGTIGAIANLTGVEKVRGYENDTSSTDGNGIPDHSISLVVSGGVVSDIAAQIARHKTPGTGTYGTTSQTVYDSHGMPLTIKFYRPTTVTVKAEVTIAVNTAWSSDYADLIKTAVANSINSVQIGDKVVISKLYLPAYLIGSAAGSSYTIVTLKISKSTDPLGTSDISLAFNEEAFCDASTNVTVVTT